MHARGRQISDFGFRISDLRPVVVHFAFGIRHPAFAIPCAAICLALIACQPTTTAADPIKVEQLPGLERFDDSAVSYLYRMGWERREKALAGTTSLAVTTDPAVQALWTDIQRAAARKGHGLQTVRLLMSLLKQDTVMAAMPGGADAPNAWKHVIVAQTDADNHVEISKLLADHLKSLEDQHQPARRLQMGDQIFYESSRLKGSYFDLRRDGFYWLNDPDSPTPTLKGFGKKPLAEQPLFRDAAAKVLEGTSGMPIAYFHHDLRSTWKQLMATEGGQLWKQMSWSCVQSSSGATFVDPQTKLLRNRYYWKLGSERAGLFQFTREGRPRPEWLKRVPADASGFVAGMGDMTSFVMSLMYMGSQLWGDVSADEITQAMAQVMMLKPVLQNLGPRYLIYRRPRKYGAFPMFNVLPYNDTVFVLQSANPEGFVNGLSGLVRQMTGPNASLKAHKIGDVTVQSISLLYVTLHAAILDGAVMFAFDAQVIKDAVENWTKPGPTLIDTDDYQAAAKYLLPDACFMLYIRPGGLATGYYDRYVPVAQQGLELLTNMEMAYGDRAAPPDPKLQGLDAFLLPRGSDLARHIKHGTILSARDDGQGVLFDGRAPVLRTAYYWTYLYQLTRIGGGGLESAAEVMSLLFLPPQAPPPPPPEAEPAPQPIP